MKKKMDVGCDCAFKIYFYVNYNKIQNNEFNNENLHIVKTKYSLNNDVMRLAIKMTSYNWPSAGIKPTNWTPFWLNCLISEGEQEIVTPEVRDRNSEIDDGQSTSSTTPPLPSNDKY